MTKKELLHTIAEKTNMSLPVAEVFLEAVVETVQDALCAGREINIPGLGKFDVKAKAARKGRNPATGEAITISARILPRFKPSSLLMMMMVNKESLVV